MENSVEINPQVTELLTSGINLTRKKYGREGTRPKEFHNEEHVAKVIYAARVIGQRAGLSDKEISYLEIAAAYHDSEVELGPGQGEDESARLCAAAMKQKGWADEETKIVTDLIKATKYEFKNGTIHQSVGDNPNEQTKEGLKIGLMKRVMADADLSANGSEWEEYEKWSLAIGKEMKVLTSEPSNEGWLKFWRWQYDFLNGLSKRGFYTEAAKLEYSDMEKNLEMVVQRIESFGGTLEQAN